MSQNITVPVHCLEHGSDLGLPFYATPDSAGMDLVAAIDSNITLESGGRCLVPTGIILALPSGYEAQIRPRSGLAHKNGITVLNSPGTIDSDYRGELKVILINLGKETFCIERGMRIAQMVIAPFTQAILKPHLLPLEETKRSSAGFGSTGLKGSIP